VSVVLTERQGAVLLVTLNRPEQLNALNPELLGALAETWHDAGDPEIRAVVVTGAGRGFCAGADLHGFAGSRHPGSGGMRHTFHPHILGLANLAKPVIAAVNGTAAGAGLSVALAADVRMCSETARFVPAFAKIGLGPDCGASYFLPRIVGYPRAFEWLASARPLSAAEALAWGLVNRVVASESLLVEALELATQMADMPGLAVAVTKRLLAHPSASLAEQLEREAAAQVEAAAAPGRGAARAAVVAAISSPRHSAGGGSLFAATSIATEPASPTEVLQHDA
jgi:2-(1,2-epoxy-1,2-dihydrophenyl)acetyl-CoA isomerase